jgi:hypothetical protein
MDRVHTHCSGDFCQFEAVSEAIMQQVAGPAKPSGNPPGRSARLTNQRGEDLERDPLGGERRNRIQVPEFPIQPGSEIRQLSATGNEWPVESGARQ